MFFLGYYTSDYDSTSNGITFDLVMTLVNHVNDDNSPYDFTFVVWERREEDDLEILWTGEHSVSGNNDEPPEMVSQEYW